jgi:hypothetical protein
LYWSLFNNVKLQSSMLNSSQIYLVSEANPGQFSLICSRYIFFAMVSSSKLLICRTRRIFSILTQISILRLAVSHRREANGVPGPTWRKRRRPQNCIWLSFLTVVFLISVHVPAPFRRLGTQQASHKRSPVSIPPATWDLQSLTMCAISRQAAHIFPSLASIVAFTDSARPPDERI